MKNLPEYFLQSAPPASSRTLSGLKTGDLVSCPWCRCWTRGRVDAAELTRCSVTVYCSQTISSAPELCREEKDKHQQPSPSPPPAAWRTDASAGEHAADEEAGVTGGSFLTSDTAEIQHTPIQLCRKGLFNFFLFYLLTLVDHRQN